MPGVLPMKIIRVGDRDGANLRIAQACDRCRSKKIRCDGVRPCCTQCANVGFECKTSDKLSRRAFPRGYTESLEERVRIAETEVRDLKEILDSKDEKIDMLSRIHAGRPSMSPPQRTTPATTVSPSDIMAKPESAAPVIVFKVQQTQCLIGTGPDAYFIGNSSGILIIESFKQKLRDKGRSVNDISPARLLRSAGSHAIKPLPTTLSPLQSRPPSFPTSDQLVNIYLQEWAPLFPVLHGPTFLSLYNRFKDSAESVTDKKSIAQIYLAFGLAAISKDSTLQADMSSFELQWQSALQQVQHEQSLSVLQSLLLAQLYCMHKGDSARLLHYKSLATPLAARMGLQQSQKAFALDPLAGETRKRVFWSMYTIDCFSAVQLGLPPQIRDDQVFCELPVNTDDDYITESGFQSMPPGESTRISSALALFRAARIMSKVLTQLYPSASTYELSSRQISEISDELDSWQKSLAPHLRLPFALDKPSAGTVTSRSFLLSLAYHYIRTLVHRPAACSSGTTVAAPSMLALANSSKHIAQILNLMTERGFAFTFCLNKEELLVLSGFGLLTQSLGLEESSTILRDGQKTLALIVGQLDKMRVLTGPEFRRVASSFVQMPAPKSHTLTGATHEARRSSSETAFPGLPGAVKDRFNAVTARFSSNEARPLEGMKDQRRMTNDGTPIYRNVAHAQSQPVLTKAQLALLSPRVDPNTSPLDVDAFLRVPRTGMNAAQSAAQQPRTSLNLDYLELSTSAPTSTFDLHQAPQNHDSDWKKMLADLDSGGANIFNGIYGGPIADLLSMDSSKPADYEGAVHIENIDNVPESSHTWDREIWDVISTDLTHAATDPTISESAISLSAEDETHGDSMDQEEAGAGTTVPGYAGFLIPDLPDSDELWGDGIGSGYMI